MAKRAAETQLSRDTQDDEDDVEVATGFQAADPTTLATRKIKGLPKRKGAAPPALPSGAPMTSKFTGFSSPPAPGTAASLASTIYTPPLSTPPATPPVQEAAELAYYRSLRGLNVSLTKKLEQLILADPFADVASVMEEYTKFRASVQADYEKSKEKSEQDKAAGGEGAKTAAAPPPVVATLPVPPKTFSFGGKIISVDNPASTTSGPTPPSSATSSGFTPSGGFGGFSFGSGAKPTFNFGATSSGFGGFAGFGSSSTAATGSSIPSLPTTTSTPFKFGESTESKASTSSFDKLTAETKDSKADDSSSTSAVLTTPPKPPPSNYFATPPTRLSPAGSGFGFGAAKKPGVTAGSGSLFSGVGFGFGTSPPKEGMFSFGSGTSTSTTIKPAFGGFAGFGAPAAAPAGTSSQTETKEGESEGGGGGSEAGDVAPTPEAMALLADKYDAEGPGEEDEETVHTVRAKLYKQVDKKWSELGVGNFRLKKHKETGARRGLWRNGSTGKLGMNFAVFPQLEPKVEKRAVTLLVMEEGSKPQFYLLRVKTAADAEKLGEQIEEMVKAMTEAK